MKLKTAFVCTGNSCRSQMAEGFAKYYGNDVLEVYSAGTRPAPEVNPNAIQVMEEIGIDISSHRPKLLDDIPYEMDILIKMGCGVVCPFVPNNHQEDWGLPDPAGQPLDEFRRVRDMIKEKVLELVEKVKKGELG
ncbi:MAG: arsenate reductase ArsC [Clostridiales bacterium]|nr:arsenate reductase ArsC [Eubacteriales bacterium]MDH7565771.1 arsenate reductase ArsC [Clostridiales bacterium]